MSTVASLQIKIGADVSAAIDGLTKSEFVTNNLAKAMDVATQKSNAFNNFFKNFQKTIDDVSTYETLFFDSAKEATEANKIKKVVDELAKNLESNINANPEGFFSKGFEFDLNLLGDLKKAVEDISKLDPDFSGLSDLKKYVTDFEKIIDQDLSKATLAPEKVLQALQEATAATIPLGFEIAGWALNFSTALNVVQKEIDAIDQSNLDEETQKSIKTLDGFVKGAQNVAEKVGSMAAAFSGAQAVAVPALSAIAASFPAMGASIAALAGPIGIAVGLVAALGAAYLSNSSSINKVLTEEQKLNQQITQEIAQAGVLFGVLKSGNLTQEKRGALIEDINKKYDTTLKNLKDETEFVAQADVAYQQLSESIKNKILLAGSQKELEGLIAAQIASEGLLVDVEALQKAVPKANEELLKLGASPSQTFDPKTFLGGASTVLSLQTKIAGQQDVINKKTLAFGALYNKVFGDIGKGSGGGGKGLESEAQKNQAALDEFAKAIEIIQEKNKNGLLPDKKVFDAQVDAIYGTIDKLASINIKSDVFKQFVEEAKAFFNQEKVEIPVVPRIQVDEVATLTPVDPLADRMKAAVEEKLKGIKILIDDTSAISSVQSFAEKFKKEIEGLQQALDIAGQIGSALSGAIGQSNDNEYEGKRQALDAYYERESELIESSISNDTLKNRKKEQLEKEVAQKRKQIARQEALSQKNLNIFEATINTANAVTRALATGGPILAGIVGALGLAQVAAIASAPLPALAGGALVTGPSFVQVGEYPGAAQNPEFISPVDKAQKYIREAVQQAGGGGSQQLYSFVDGDDLGLISDRYNYRKSRLG